MPSSNDLIKYFTQEVVRYLDTPKQDRKRKIKEPVTYHWFGFMPLSFTMTARQFEKHLKLILHFSQKNVRAASVKLKALYLSIKNKFV